MPGSGRVSWERATMRSPTATSVRSRPAARARSHEPLHVAFEAFAGRVQLRVVLVEGVGEHRAERPDPLVGRRVHEAAQRVEGVGLLGGGRLGPSRRPGP